MSFLKNVLAAIVALIIFSVAAFFIGLGIISAITAKEKVEVKSNSVLHLKFDKPVTEMEFDNPFENFGAFNGQASSIGLFKLKEVLKQAAEDDNIRGVYVDVHYFIGGMATLQEVRDALEEFKESGKFVYAYSEYYSEGAYYLASVADKVMLHPEGEVELNGLNANITFFKGTMEKFGIEPQIFRVGEFKSAVEPFMRKDMSAENELQLTEMFHSLNNGMLAGISRSRGIALNELENISNKMLVREAEDALALNLVDHLYYADQFRDELDNVDSVDFNMISYEKYKASYSNYKRTSNKIAVIVANGDIVSGKGEAENVGSDKFAKLIREAREDESVKAIVMRVNSPGGSYIASDVIWRELMLARQEKPVIASMADYAASGGYYLSMPCDTIVAQHNTITGSIGIFAMLFNFEEFLEERLGITHDQVETGEFSGMYTVTRSLTDAEKSIIQKSLEKNYETFVTKAAQGREMSVEELKEVASGRVWTGEQAVERGLVDILGSFDDAVQIAADKAGLGDDYKLRFYPEPKPVFEQLLEDLGAQARASIFASPFGDVADEANYIKRVKKYHGVQARMPYEIEFY